MTVNIFYVGDRIRVTSGSYFVNRGETGTVVNILKDRPDIHYLIRGEDGGCFWLTDRQIELIPTKQTYYEEES